MRWRKVVEMGGSIELQKRDFQIAMEVRTPITLNLFECSLYSSIFLPPIVFPFFCKNLRNVNG